MMQWNQKHTCGEGEKEARKSRTDNEMALEWAGREEERERGGGGGGRTHKEEEQETKEPERKDKHLANRYTAQPRSLPHPTVN
jgi:hypothetical protein